MLKKSTRPISTGLSEISETSHEPNSTQESESLDLADIESRDVTQYDDDSDRIGSNIIWLIYMTHNIWLILYDSFSWIFDNDRIWKNFEFLGHVAILISIK